MSLFNAASHWLGAQGDSQTAASAVLSMVNSHPGGLSGLISAFEQNGLGGVVRSWVQPGVSNQSVTAEQVQSTLSESQITSIAEKLGIPSSAASGVVAELLPRVIDHLTPNGEIPSQGTNLQQLGEDLLKRFI